MLLPMCSGVAMELEQARGAPNPFMGTPRSVTPSAHSTSPLWVLGSAPPCLCQGGEAPCSASPCSSGLGASLSNCTEPILLQENKSRGEKKTTKTTLFL